MDFVEIDCREKTGEWSMSALQSHDYVEIYFLLEGTRRLFIGDKTFTVNAPALCVIPPFRMHKTEGGAYRRINVNVSRTFLTEGERALIDGLAKECVYSLESESFKDLLFALNLAVKCKPTPENPGLYVSFMHIILHLLSNAPLAPKSVEEEREKDNSVIRKVVEYVNKNFNNDFSVNDLCRRFYISKNTLTRSFYNLMKCSVTEYRTFLRISKAKELLSAGVKNMDEVAEAVGYSSANYFSLIFKRNVGIAPTYYRKSK